MTSSSLSLFQYGLLNTLPALLVAVLAIVAGNTLWGLWMRRQQKRSLREFVEFYRGWLVDPSSWYSKVLEKDPGLDALRLQRRRCFQAFVQDQHQFQADGTWNRVRFQDLFLLRRVLAVVEARLTEAEALPDESPVGADSYDHSCYQLLFELLDTMGYTGKPYYPSERM